MKKDTLLKGTLILAIAALIARGLGLVQRVPLQYYLDDYGMALYGIAYNIYFALLIIATAGIPSALSKLVADRLALNKHEEAQAIYRAAVRFALVAGVVMTMLLYFVAPFYATHVAHVPESALAIQALAPALLLFPLIAIMRGYFQGRQNMTAGGISQVSEQILRVVTAVLFVMLLTWWGYSLPIAAAGAAFGGVMGSIGAFLVMLYFWRFRTERQPQTTQPRAESVPPMRDIYKQIFRLSVPISVISIIVPAIYFIDSSLAVPLIQGYLAGGAREAQELLGILVGRAQSFAGIPPILAIALSTSVIPVISAAFARQDQPELIKQSSMALRLAMLAGIPIVIMLCVAARSYNVFLFGDERGTWIIIALTMSALLQIVMMTSGAILMGLGLTRAPMIHVGIGILLKLLLSVVLTPWFGMYGMIAATAAAFGLILWLNLRQLRKHIAVLIFGRRWYGLSLVIVLMVVLGSIFEQTLFADERAGFAWLIALTSSILLTILYPLLLALFGVIRKSDVELMPLRLQHMLKRINYIKILRS